MTLRYHSSCCVRSHSVPRCNGRAPSVLLGNAVQTSRSEASIRSSPAASHHPAALCKEDLERFFLIHAFLIRFSVS